MQIVGTRGFKGKKTMNANTMFNNLFEVVDGTDEDSVEFSEERLDELEKEVS
jgi:hypothetical protein